jgi:hypothetical protein
MANPINFNCRDFKCKDTVVSLYDLVGENLEVKLTGNKSYSGLPNRTLGDDDRAGPELDYPLFPL